MSVLTFTRWARHEYMSPLPKRSEDSLDVSRAIQNEIGGNVPRFDFHTLIELRFGVVKSTGSRAPDSRA